MNIKNKSKQKTKKSHINRNGRTKTKPAGKKRAGTKSVAKKASGISEKINANLFLNKRFITGSVQGLEPKGIVHVSEAIGINAIRNAATDFANFFGSSGFESELYDKAKTNAFKKLKKIVSSKNYVVGDIKMDIETTQNTIFCHLIGTVYKHKK